MIRKEIIAYNTDASRIIGKIEKVVFPKNVKEVSEIIRVTNLDIVPRGAGSGFEGGVVPNSSLVMDMTKMNNIISFSPSKRVIVVESGIILKELNEKLMAKGYEFPIDTLNKGISTIGGMIATNASGKRAMKYGSIRDWLDEIEFVNGKGEIVKTSKADLTDACGMEGITGVITSAKIRVLPRIKRSFSIFQTDKLEDVLHVGRRLKSEKEVCSVILFSKQISKMLGFIERYYLLVEFDSERGKIKGQEYEKLLKKIENLYYNLGLNDYYNSEDPKLFFDKIKEFLEILEIDNIPYFSYLGSGVVHPFFKDSEKEKRRSILEYIKRTQIKLGKYGYGLKRKDFLESFESKLIQRVKQRQDPNGKFNKGKLIDFTGYPEQKVQIKNKTLSSVSPKSEPMEEKVEKITRPIVLKDSFKEERREIKPMIGEEITAKSIEGAFLEEPSGRTGLLKENEKTPEEKINEFIKEVESEEIEIEEVESEGVESETVERGEIVEKKFVNNQSLLNFIEKKEVESFAREIPKEIIKQTNLPLKPRLTDNYNAIKHNVEDKPLKKPETSQEERDLINKILGNRFGNINKGDKRE